MGSVSFLPNLKIIPSQKSARLLPKANGIHCEIAAATSGVEGSNSGGLGIKKTTTGGHMLSWVALGELGEHCSYNRIMGGECVCMLANTNTHTQIY